MIWNNPLGSESSIALLGLGACSGLVAAFAPLPAFAEGLLYGSAGTAIVMTVAYLYSDNRRSLPKRKTNRDLSSDTALRRPFDP